MMILEYERGFVILRLWVAYVGAGALSSAEDKKSLLLRHSKQFQGKMSLMTAQRMNMEEPHNL